jgi:hypothetical protein
VAVKAGTTLRKVSIDVGNEQHTFGGLWLGVELGLTIDHVGPG